MKDPLKIFSPSSEPSSMNGLLENLFFTGHPYLALINGEQEKVPWMIDVNSAEGLLTSFLIAADQELIKNWNANWTDNLASDFLVYNKNNFPNLTKDMSKFYLTTATEDGKVDFMTDLVGFTNIISNRFFIHSTLEAVNIQAKESTVFLYVLQ